MVLKLNYIFQLSTWLFENDVKMYGTQAVNDVTSNISLFENDVKMYGTQANIRGLTK